MGKQRGVAVILAIFIAMVAFTSAAIIGLRAHHDLQTTRLGARQVQRRMAVTGAVNHLLSMLRRGDGLQYTQASPLVLDVAGIPGIKVWAMPDATVANVIHIQAELMGIISTKALTSTPPLDSVVFFEDNNTLYSRKPNDVNWTQLPAHPATVYDSSGTASLLPGGEVQDIETTHDGKLYVEVYQGGMSWQQGVSLWDNQSQSWSTVPALQNFSFTSGSLQMGTGHQPVHLDGADQDKLFSLTNEGLAVFDATTQDWDYFSRPPGERGRFAAAGGGKFAVQMQDIPGGSSWLSVFEGGSWGLIPIADQTVIPRGINEDGEIFFEHGAAIKKWDNGWQTIAAPPGLTNHSLRAVDAEGALILATPAGDVARWDQQSPAEQYLIPPGTSFFQSDWRQFGGGGELQPGALPVLEVVSSY